jgi:hypothetical protein
MVFRNSKYVDGEVRVCSDQVGDAVLKWYAPGPESMNVCKAKSRVVTGSL